MNQHIVKLDKDGNGESLVRTMVEKLQEIYRHEHHHFNFYLQASLICHGPSRLYLKPLFEKEMMSELEHIRAFGNKIFALGQLPTTERLNFCISDAVNDQDFIQMAINIEREVLRLYHNLYPFAEKFADVYKDKSIVLLLEENIEHTTDDVEELEKLL